MEVYFVVEAPVAAFEDTIVFTALDQNNAAAFPSEEEANECATEQARINRGRSFWVVKGKPSHSFRCKPEPVMREDPVVTRVERDY